MRDATLRPVFTHETHDERNVLAKLLSGNECMGLVVGFASKISCHYSAIKHEHVSCDGREKFRTTKKNK